MKRILLIISVVFLLGICGAYVGLRIWLKCDIDRICGDAQIKYEGDKIEALILLLESDTESLESKNQAIWALGKTRGARAMSTLKALQTNEVCNHSELVCQRELEKAIANLGGNRIDLFTFK